MMDRFINAWGCGVIGVRSRVDDDERALKVRSGEVGSQGAPAEMVRMKGENARLIEAWAKVRGADGSETCTMCGSLVLLCLTWW